MVDLGGCFCPGQAYVALSRAKRLAGLQVGPHITSFITSFCMVYFCGGLLFLHRRLRLRLCGTAGTQASALVACAPVHMCLCCSSTPVVSLLLSCHRICSSSALCQQALLIACAAAADGIAAEFCLAWGHRSRTSPRAPSKPTSLPHNSTRPSTPGRSTPSSPTTPLSGGPLLILPPMLFRVLPWQMFCSRPTWLALRFVDSPDVSSLCLLLHLERNGRVHESRKRDFSAGHYQRVWGSKMRGMAASFDRAAAVASGGFRSCGRRAGWRSSGARREIRPPPRRSAAGRPSTARKAGRVRSSMALAAPMQTERSPFP